MSDETPEASRPLPSDLPAVSRLAAGNALRDRLKDKAGLGPISDAAASFLYDFFDADESAVSLLKGEWFRTLVTVRAATPGQLQHPDGDTYSVKQYPNVARLLTSGSGYVASIGNDGGVPESQDFLRRYRMTTCIGAPITYGGDVVGEVFVSRVAGRSHYTGRELAGVLDLARQIGYRMGPAVKAMDANDASWWPNDTSASEIGELGDH
ncbi:MAG: GAF domain-containing protein [Actinomycetia bacterium]|nr:GAF domain-containing protein [Actinomycetes bacterium]